MEKLEQSIRDAIENERNELFLAGLLLTKRHFTDEVEYRYDSPDKYGEQKVEYIDEHFIEYKIECSKSAFLHYFYGQYSETIPTRVIISDSLWFSHKDDSRNESIIIFFNKGDDKSE